MSMTNRRLLAFVLMLTTTVACGRTPPPELAAKEPEPLPPPRVLSWNEVGSGMPGERFSAVARLGATTVVGGATVTGCCSVESKLWNVVGDRLHGEKLPATGDPEPATVGAIVANGQELLVGGSSANRAAAWRRAGRSWAEIELGSRVENAEVVAGASAGGTLHWAVHAEQGVELVTCDAGATVRCRPPAPFEGAASNLLLAATSRTAVAALSGDGVVRLWFAEQASGWIWRPTELVGAQEVIGLVASEADIVAIATVGAERRAFRTTTGTDWRNTTTSFPFDAAEVASVGTVFAAAASSGNELQLSVSSDGVNWSSPVAAPPVAKPQQGPQPAAIGGSGDVVVIAGFSSGDAYTGHVWEVSLQR